MWFIVVLPMIVLLRILYLQRRKKKDWSKLCESYIERKLYFALSRKYHVETQIGCGYYRIDITLPDYGIAIECDGHAFHSSPEQKKHDAKKNRYLRKNGWYVMRFTGKDIVNNPYKVVKAIDKAVLNKT